MTDLRKDGHLQKARAYTRELHVHRVRNGKSPVVDDELDRELTMYWLRTVPGYRDLIRLRVHEMRKAQMEKDKRILAEIRKRQDVDNLGPEVEGCG